MWLTTTASDAGDFTCLDAGCEAWANYADAGTNFAGLLPSSASEAVLDGSPSDSYWFHAVGVVTDRKSVV